MSVEINFPLEFLIEGTPVSSQTKTSASRDAWKDQVADEARAVLQVGHWATEDPVAVTIFYFPPAPMGGDVDNIAKFILDALKALVYLDDRQVERVWVQKFEPDRTSVFRDPTPCLAGALDRERPIVYIRIDNDLSRGVGHGY